MSQIFVVEDITANYILYESSPRLFSEVVKLFAEDHESFFADYEFINDNEPTYTQFKTAAALVPEIEFILTNIAHMGDDDRLSGMSKKHALSYFQDMKSYFTKHPDNHICCFVYP